MATLGRTTITELNLLNKLTNENIANPQITINGTKVNLGGSVTISTSDTACTQTGHYPPSTVSTTVGNTSQQTPSHGGTFNIPYIQYDSKGHIVSANTTTVKLPTDSNTHYTTHMYLGGSSATSDATSDVTNPYIRLFDDTTAREDIQISGSTNISVTGKNGIISISGTDTKNTAGSSNSTSKLYLIGATSQTSAGTQSYSNNKCYISGSTLYSNSQPVVTVDAFSQFNNEIYNYIDDIVESGTVNNANKIGGQTIDEIIDQLQIQTPTVSTATTANIIGFNGGRTYMSDVIMSGNSISAPNGFYQESDERLKTFVSDVEVDLDKIAELPKKFFYWNGREDEGLQMGTSAQEVQKLYPEIVQEGKDGKLVIDYTKLAIVALKAIDVLNMERKQMKSDIEQIKEKLGL